MEDSYVVGQQKRYKLIMVGDSNVGKTALFWRFIEGEFLGHKETQVTTIDFKIKDVVVKQKRIKLYIWDTAGQEQYRSIISTYFKGCHGIMLVFDQSQHQSFKNATQQWYDLIKSKVPQANIILVGNKNDLDKQVKDSQVNQWALKHGITFISTSVKLNQNVSQAYLQLAQKINCNSKQITHVPSFQVLYQKKNQSRRKKCCK